jgi:hypothetical protein
MPHVGETVSIRFDPDDVGDWAWGDAAMYAPASPAAPVTQPAAPGMPAPTQGAVPAPASSGDESMVEFIQNAAGPWGRMPGFKGMIEAAMSAGQVSFEQAQVIDARGNPQLREQWINALKAQGVDVEAMQVGGMPAAMPAPGASSSEDPSERLRKLDALLEQGAITADEHRQMRQKIIDSI